MIFGTQDDQQAGMVTSGAPADDNSFATTPPAPTDDTMSGAPAPTDSGFSSDTVSDVPEPTPTEPTYPSSMDSVAPDTTPPAEPSVIEPSQSTPAEEMVNEPLTPEPIQPSNPAADELLDLKQKALSDLGPLVDHLDQTPEEKFRTTMMMIQSTDNQQLLKDAYEAAQAIPDDKTRAQALLDVVNEINYFTQQSQSQS